MQPLVRVTHLYGYFVNAVRALYVFSPGIIFLLLYYFIIIVLPLGQDMIMQSGEEVWASFFTCLTVLLWTLFSWFSSRIIADKWDNDKYGQIFNSHIPRLLGYNVPVGLQVAILHLPSIGVPHWLPWSLLFAHNLLYVLLALTFDYRKKWTGILSGALSACYLAYLVSLLPGQVPIHERHRVSVIVMAMFFFVLQVFFTWFVTFRRRVLISLDDKKNDLWLRMYALLGLVAVLIYIRLVFSTRFAELFGALGCTILGMAILLGFIYLIRYGAILAKVKLGLLLLLLAVTIGFFSDPYEVELVPGTTEGKYKARPQLDVFLHKWLTHKTRRQAVLKGNYPVYVVIADGGASKSGYWVASVLSKLESESDKNDPFSEHLLSLAGASGGSVGNAAFYVMLQAKHRGRMFDMQQEARAFFSGDYLTYTLARFLGADIYRHFIPTGIIDDRAAALEQSMEKRRESKFISKAFSRTFNKIINVNGRAPILFINTTNLQTGGPGILSSVRTSTTFSSREDVLQLVDDTARKNPYRANIKLSTAVLLGARFPYLSPAGNVRGRYFVDGGYFDNSGAGITLELLQHIQSVARDTSNHHLGDLLRKIHLKVIYISNGSLQKGKARRLHPLANDAAAPLLALGSTRGEQTSMGNARLQQFLKQTGDSCLDHFVALNLPMLHNDTIPYPMNWVISAYHLHRMEKNLEAIDVKRVLEIR